MTKDERQKILMQMAASIAPGYMASPHLKPGTQDIGSYLTDCAKCSVMVAETILELVERISKEGKSNNDETNKAEF